MAPPKGKRNQEERTRLMQKRMQFAFLKQFPRCVVEVVESGTFPNTLFFLEIKGVVSYCIFENGETRLLSLDESGIASFQFDNYPQEGDRDRRIKSHDRMWRLFMASPIGQEKIKAWNALPKDSKRIPTGFPVLDEALARDLPRGALTTFGARRKEPDVCVYLKDDLVRRITSEPEFANMTIDDAVAKLVGDRLDEVSEAKRVERWLDTCMKAAEELPVGTKFGFLHVLAGNGAYNSQGLCLLAKRLRESGLIKVLEGAHDPVALGQHGKTIPPTMERV